MINIRARAHVLGLALVILGVLDALVAPVFGLVSPVDGHIDQALMFAGFALELL